MPAPRTKREGGGVWGGGVGASLGVEQVVARHIAVRLPLSLKACKLCSAIPPAILNPQLR